MEEFLKDQEEGNENKIALFEKCIEAAIKDHGRITSLDITSFYKKLQRLGLVKIS